MKAEADVARRRPPWTAATLLRGMLAAQCALALIVVASDLPDAILGDFLTVEPRAPSPTVPVSPGNQTRQFDPEKLYVDRLGPGMPSGDGVPTRLQFSIAEVAGRDGAALLTGTIAEGDSLRFADWLEALPEAPSAFALQSPGGVVGEALTIGRTIRETGLSVVVAADAMCLSACPYVLAGGVEREVSRRAYVGVHQHYFEENTYLPAFLLVSDIQIGQGEVMNYLGEMGIDPMLMAKALMTPPDDIYILIPEELNALKLSTIILD